MNGRKLCKSTFQQANVQEGLGAQSSGMPSFVRFSKVFGKLGYMKGFCY